MGWTWVFLLREGSKQIGLRQQGVVCYVCENGVFIQRGLVGFGMRCQEICQ